VGRLEKIIKNSFTEVGKGWFNIHETSKETYEFGKLKKFLTLVNFMMQDTILSLGKDSVRQFVSFMMQYIPKETHIYSTSSVKNVFEKPPKPVEEGGPEEEDANLGKEIPESEMTLIQKVRKEMDAMFSLDKDPEPLFVLDLILKPNQLIPNYSVEPRDIVTKILEVFDEGIECLQ
jgi:dynein heavy chain